MIQDRIVVGLKDAKVSEKLQLDPDLTLAKATHTDRQNEAVKKQQALMRNDFKESTKTSKEVDAVRTKNSQKNRKHSTSGGQKKQNKQVPPTMIKCDCCGKSSSHPRQSCLAMNE